jgi:hypothetical protein
MVDTEVIAGLAFGYFGSQFLGNYVENKLKPGIAATATNQDKMLAGASNDGPKLALALSAYSLGKSHTSPFMKNVAWGSVLAALLDASWRYTHNGVPYGYMPFNIPLLGDLNGIVSGPNPGMQPNNNHLPTQIDTTESILAKGQELLAAPPMSPAKRQTMCNSIKTEAISKNRPYTAQEMELCTGLLSLQDGKKYQCTGSPDYTCVEDTNGSYNSIEECQTACTSSIAPSQEEYMPSTIPDRKSRFAFMEENVDRTAKHFGFTLGSPISEREKYFGMKT